MRIVKVAIAQRRGFESGFGDWVWIGDKLANDAGARRQRLWKEEEEVWHTHLEEYSSSGGSVVMALLTSVCGAIRIAVTVSAHAQVTQCPPREEAE